MIIDEATPGQIQGFKEEESSASGVSQLISTMKQRKENPPPYSVNYRNTVSTRGHVTSGGDAPSVFEPSPSVNQLHLQTGAKPILGTFYIDPSIPSLGFDPKHYNKSQKKSPPHASFVTRQGSISLDLATTGDLHVKAKATILVASRTGDIRINLLSTPATRPRIGLEAYSRRGDIVLLLPQTFCGVIQLSTRKGSLNFLPALAAMMVILKKTEDEALVLVGNSGHLRPNDPRVLDFCDLQSRFGKLVVGMSGQDKHEPRVGFWKKLGSILRQDSDMS